MTAPAPSPYEQEQIDRFGIFEAEERVVEEVARALADEDLPDFPFTALADDELARYRRLAAAAVAGYRAAQDGGAEEAVRRVEAVAEEFDAMSAEAAHLAASPIGDAGLAAVARAYHRAANDIRAALAPQAGDGAR